MAKALTIAGMAGMLTFAAVLYVEEHAQAFAALDCNATPQADPGCCD